MGATNLEGLTWTEGGAEAHLGQPHQPLRALAATQVGGTQNPRGCLGGKFPLGWPALGLGGGAKAPPPRLYKEEGRVGA